VAQALEGAMSGLGGETEYGEMAIAETGRGWKLPTGLYARWSST
jgi:hypothetical protein